MDDRTFSERSNAVVSRDDEGDLQVVIYDAPFAAALKLTVFGDFDDPAASSSNGSSRYASRSVTLPAVPAGHYLQLFSSYSSFYASAGQTSYNTQYSWSTGEDTIDVPFVALLMANSGNLVQFGAFTNQFVYGSTPAPLPITTLAAPTTVTMTGTVDPRSVPRARAVPA